MSPAPTWAVEISPTTDPFEAPVWDDETAYVRAFSVARGRQQALDEIQPGTATVTVDNKARRFDPNHAGGPHYGNLLPGRRLRIRGSLPWAHGGTTFDGTAGEYWTSGTVPNVNTATTRIVVVACVVADDYTPSTSRYIGGWGAASGSSNSLPAYLYLASTGAPGFQVVESGGTARFATSTVALGAVDGSVRWIMADFDPVSETTDFYVSTNAPDHHPGYDPAGHYWTLHEANKTFSAAWNNTFQSRTTAGISHNATTAWDGKIYYLSGALNGLTPSFEIDFRQETNGATSFVDERGITWTATGTGVAVTHETGTTYDVFGGFVGGWPVPGLNLGESPVPVTDGFSLLAAAALESPSPLEIAIGNLGPVHWWKLDDPQDSAVVLDHGSAKRDAVPYEGAETLLGADGLDLSTSSTAYGGDGATGYFQIVPEAAWTSFVAVFTADVGSVGQQIYLDPVNQQAVHLFVSGGSVVYVGDATDADASTIFVDDGLRHVLVIVKTGAGAFSIYVDGVDVTGAGGTVDFTNVPKATLAARVTTTGNGSYWDGKLAHVATFDFALSADERTTLFDGGEGWGGDTIDGRIDRLLDLSGWRTAERDLDSSDVGTLDPGPAGSDALADVRDLTASEGGSFYQEPDFTMRFRSRFAPSIDERSSYVQYTFSDSAKGPRTYRFENPVVGAQGEWLRNRIIVSWLGGSVTVNDTASQATYGIREHTIDTILPTAGQAQNLAELVLYRYKEPIVVIESLELNLGAEPLGWEAALGAELGDRVRVIWTPGTVGSPVGSAIDVEALVEGKTISLGRAGTGRATFWLSSAVPASDLWIWDTSLWDTSTVWG